jgi:O-antigen/teichoic acid export membrane protein
VLQVCAALMFQINTLIIAQLLGAEAVPAYAVPERMFGIIGMILGFVLSPLWPAYGDAVARGDIAWTRKVLRRSLVLGGGIAAGLSGLMVLAAPQLLHWWVGDAITVPFMVILGFGIWKVIETVANAVAMFLNGVNVLGVQVVLALVGVVVSFIMKVWWVKLYGVSGLIFAMNATYLVFILPFLAMACRKAFVSIESRAVQHGR